MRLRTLAMAGASILAVVAIPAKANAAPGGRPLGACTLEAIQPALAANVHIESIDLKPTAGAQSSYCRVSGYVDEGSHIGFVLGLPSKWNSKFLFLGVGGFAGTPGAVDDGVARGYATASTDTGHKGDGSRDIAWALNNRPAVVNHYQRAVPLAVATAKIIIAAYYGTKPSYSYFDGCSGGGRQALVEAEDYPEEFDGIIAGAPAWDYTKLFMTFVENSNYVLAHPASWIPPESFDAIDAEVLRQCDKSDGVQDGMIADPRQCRPNLKKLLCRPGASADGCLTGDQIAALEYFSRQRSAAEVRAGWASYPLSGSDSNAFGYGLPRWIFSTKPLVRDASGRVSFAVDAEPGQFALGTRFLRYIVRNDPDFDYRTFSIARDAEQLERQMSPMTNADRTDVGAFVRRGGKLMIWHGWSDWAIPAEMSIDLYGRIQRDTKNHGSKPLSEAVRLFMVPGVQHCQYGSGLTEFDRIGALERWVERGEAPDQMVAAQVERGAVRRTRPICAFPKVARYRGTGDVNDAANFDCANPTKSQSGGT